MPLRPDGKYTPLHRSPEQREGGHAYGEGLPCRGCPAPLACAVEDFCAQLHFFAALADSEATWPGDTASEASGKDSRRKIE